MTTIRGPIEVSTESEDPFADNEGVTLNRNVVRKTFSGDLDGTSEAQMTAARTPDPGCAGYVAIEAFTGSVEGRKGSLVFLHSGVIDNGEPTLSVVIVPGSGTGELAGISGTLQIDNDEGVHSYVLDYQLPD